MPIPDSGQRDAIIGAIFEYVAVHRDLRCLLYAGNHMGANLTHLLPSPLHFNALSLAESLVWEQLLPSTPICKSPPDLVIQERAWVSLTVCKGPVEAGHNIYRYSCARTPSLLEDL